MQVGHHSDKCVQCLCVSTYKLALHAKALLCAGVDAAVDARRLMRACVCVCGAPVLGLTRR